MQEIIVEFLKRNQDYVSGDQLSSRLKVSRQALWKHIQELKALGYDIVAVPHLGYKLLSSPDRLFSFELTEGLNTKFIGRKIHYFESVSSTMDAAAKLSLEGAAEGTVVVAESQAKGRGRLGRHWFSPKYKGIYFSLILRPKILPSQAALLTLLAAVSICEAVKEIAGLDARIKWPNDILLSNKKLGGILTELNAETDKVNFVIIGAGINVNNDKKTLVPGATSLRGQKKESIDRVRLLREILRRMEANYLVFQHKGADAVINKWKDNNLTLGKRIKVVSQSRHVEGCAMDIDSDGGLLVRKDSGVIEKIMAGDCIHCR
jgi:BirA family transcriptional regulator, biotin operon repressor / biotin---[acetyl-CoA-carboxylase] ligase